MKAFHTFLCDVGFCIKIKKNFLFKKYNNFTKKKRTDRTCEMRFAACVHIIAFELESNLISHT